MSECFVDPESVAWTPHARCAGAAVLPLITAAHDAGLTVARVRLEPGAEIPSHDHQASTETLFVLSGQLHCTVGTDERTMGPDEICYAPIGVPHCISNRGDEPVECLSIFTPPL